MKVIPKHVVPIKLDIYVVLRHLFHSVTIYIEHIKEYNIWNSVGDSKPPNFTWRKFAISIFLIEGCCYHEVTEPIIPSG